MTTPSVSIVIDSYNHEKYIRDAIDSALHQDYANKEVVVIDDGSTDHSKEIIESYGDLVRSAFQENQGQVAACGQGFLLTNNEIVIFLDSDDILAPNAVTEVVAHWGPNVSKVQFSLQSIDQSGRTLPVTFPNYPDVFTPDQVKRDVLETGTYHAPTTSGNAFARSCLTKVLPIPKKFGCDIDDALNVIAPLHGDVITIPKVLGSYRVHDANQSNHSALTAKRFKKYATDAVERTAFLRMWCNKLGIPLPDDLVERDFAFQEHRLAAAVVGADACWPLLRPTLRAILGSGLNGRQKLTHSAWVLAIALGPHFLAMELLAQRFVFSRRSALLGTIVKGRLKEVISKNGSDPGHLSPTD